jgi:hypothetical protein
MASICPVLLKLRRLHVHPNETAAGRIRFPQPLPGSNLAAAKSRR